MSSDSVNEMPDISTKNTKSEILEAYKVILAKMSETKHISRQDVKKQQEDSDTVKQAESLNHERIAKNIMELKLSIVQELDALEQSMTLQHRQFRDLKSAIAIESKNLFDLYEIKKGADSCAVLLQVQKTAKENFQAEMDEQKAVWKREREEYELALKDENTKIAKERAREEEEYHYNLGLERKKDMDVYELKRKDLERDLEDIKTNFQKEFAARETAIKLKEDEFRQLQEQIKQFPHELERVSREIEKNTKSAIETYYTHQIELSAKEIDGERKLMQQTIATLQAKIKEQEAFVKQLSQRADESTTQVQEIALKAIEGASTTRFYNQTPASV